MRFAECSPMQKESSAVCRAKIYLWDFISFKSAMTDFLSFSERVLKVSATKRVSAGICGVFSVPPVTRYSTETPSARAILYATSAGGIDGFLVATYVYNARSATPDF